MPIDRRTCVALLAGAAAVPAMAQVSQPRSRTIALLFDSLISSFWLAAMERLRREIRARGWSVLEAVSNMDDNRQYQQLQSMLQRGVDGIIMIHTDDKAVIPAIRAANAAGVPLVHFNRPPAPNDGYSVAVVADNRKLMDQTVTALLDLARTYGASANAPRKAALLVGDLGDANGVHRRDGFQDAIARHGDVVTVVARIATEWNADKAFAGLTNALQAHPDIDFLVTSSDFLTPQIEQALKIAGKWHPAGQAGHVLIAGFDGDDKGYEKLAAGFYDVDGVQDLDYEVALTLHALEQMWAGQRPPKILIDPGFVISRATLTTQRDRMWGYGAWKAQAAPAVATSTNSAANPSANNLAPAMSAIPAETPAPTPTTAPTTPLTVAAFVAGAAAFAHALFSTDTLRDVLLAVLPLAILVGGQLPVLVIGQIDLSMTAIMAMGSVLSAAVMTHYLAPLGEPVQTTLGVLSTLVLGATVGLLNGICTAILRVPSFIITLAAMMAGGGAAVWYASTISDTISIGGLPGAFRFIGYGSWGGIPIALLLAGAVLGTLHYVLSRTVAGRWLYALGHNAVAARIAGVPVRGVTIAAFTASGFCAALAAVIYTSRIETGLPTLGQNQLLDIVGAAVIGGVSLFGGRGSVAMALLGAAFLCVLDKSLQLLGLSLFLVLAIKGAAILLATYLDVTRRRRRSA